MPDPTGFRFDPRLRRYRAPNGRLVSRAAVRRALDDAIDSGRLTIDQISRQLQAGVIDIGDWQLGMERLVRLIHTSSAAMAAGGWVQATAADWATAGARIREQYRYLRRFAGELESGLPLDGAFLARADMYGLSGTATYEAVTRRRDVAAGYDEERRWLHSLRPCRDCIAYAARGWVRAGELPLPTENCACLSRCRCSLSRRKSGSVPQPVATVPGFGPSLATVRVAPDSRGDEAAILDYLGRMLGGKRVERSDLAGLVGAPDDATVEARLDERGDIEIRVSGPSSSYRMERRFKPYFEDRARLLAGGMGTREPSIENVEFFVDPAHQGRGLGRSVFGRQVEQARRLGFGRITTVAARDDADGTIGYKVWPRFGYDQKLPGSIRAKLPARLNDAERLSDLMRSRSGRDWWDAHGEAIGLWFDLSPGSASLRVWDAYLKAKSQAPPGPRSAAPVEHADFPADDLDLAEAVWDAIPIKGADAMPLEMDHAEYRSAAPVGTDPAGALGPAAVPAMLHAGRADTRWLLQLAGAIPAPAAAVTRTPLEVPDEARPKVRKRGRITVMELKGPVLPSVPAWARRITARMDLVVLDEFIPGLYAALDDPGTDAVLLDVDSPGGLADGVPEAADAIFRARRRTKPVWAHVAAWGCSAAYYLGSAAARLEAAPGATIGSIGVALTLVDDSAFWEERGVKILDLVASQGPDKRPDVRTPEGIGLYRQMLDALGAQFVGDVARFRGTTESTVKADFGRGWVKVASEAQAAGMIDQVSSFEGTLRRLALEVQSRKEAGAAVRGTVAARSIVGRLAGS